MSDLQKALKNDKTLIKILKGEHKLYNWLVIQARKIEVYIESDHGGKAVWAGDMASYLDRICKDTKLNWRAMPLALNYHQLPSEESGKKLTKESRETLVDVSELFKEDNSEQELQTVEGLDFLPPWAEKEISGVTLGEVYHRYWEIRNQLGSKDDQLRLEVQDFLALFPRLHEWLTIFACETDYSRFGLTELEVKIVQGWLKDCDDYPNQVKGNPVWTWRELAQAVPVKKHKVSEEMLAFINAQGSGSVLADIRSPHEAMEVELPGFQQTSSSSTGALQAPELKVTIKAEADTDVSSLQSRERPAYGQYFISSEQESSSPGHGVPMQEEGSFEIAHPKAKPGKRRWSDTLSGGRHKETKGVKRRKKKSPSPESLEVDRIFSEASESGYQADISSSSSRSRMSSDLLRAKKRGTRRRLELDHQSSSTVSSRPESTLQQEQEDTGGIKTRTLTGERLWQEEPPEGASKKEAFNYQAIEPGALPRLERRDSDSATESEDDRRPPPSLLPEKTMEGIPVTSNKPMIRIKPEWIDKSVQANAVCKRLSGGKYWFTPKSEYFKAAGEFGLKSSEYLQEDGRPLLDGHQLIEFTLNWLKGLSIRTLLIDTSDVSAVAELKSRFELAGEMLEYVQATLDELKNGVDQQIEPYVKNQSVPSTMAEDFAELNDASLQGASQLSQYKVAIQRLLWSLDAVSEEGIDPIAKAKLSKQSVLYNWRLLDQLCQQPVHQLVKAMTAPDRWPVIDSIRQINRYNGETVVPEPLLKLAGSAGRKLLSSMATGTTMVKLNETQLSKLTTDCLNMLVVKYGDKDRVQTETLVMQKDRFECAFWLLDQLVRIAKTKPKAEERRSLFNSLSGLHNTLEAYRDSLQTGNHSLAATGLKNMLDQEKKKLSQLFSVGQQGDSSSS